MGFPLQGGRRASEVREVSEARAGRAGNPPVNPQ